jgi:hypothetical protein
LDILGGREENEEWVEDLYDYNVSQGLAMTNAGREKGKGPERRTSAVDVLLKSIQGFVSNLMSLSILIRSSAPRDDYVKAASRYNHLISGPDKSHVWEKFGNAKYTQPWLLDRLGEAITMRRRFLLYRSDHHNRMMEEKANAAAKDQDANTVVASTKATTFFVSENATQHVRAASPDFGGSFGSVTSYEPTMFEGEEKVKKFSVPPPPCVAFPDTEIPFEYEEPFQCQFCYTEQVVKDKADWKYA